MSKKKKKYAGCESCENCIPIGEGDHICYECDGDEPALLVLEDYTPTKNYLACNGKRFERK